MKIKYRNKKDFKEFIYQSGYNFSSLSIAINASRQYISNSTTKDCIGPVTAKRICDILNRKFDEIFYLEGDLENGKHD